MNILERISIKIRLLYLVLVIIIVALVSTLTFLNATNSIAEMTEFVNDLGLAFDDIHKLDNLLMEYQAASYDDGTDSIKVLHEIQSLCNDFLLELDGYSQQAIIRENDTLVRLVTGIKEEIQGLQNNPPRIWKNTTTGVPGSFSIQSHSSILDKVFEARSGLLQSLHLATISEQKRYTLNLLIVLLSGILAIILLVSITEVSNYNSIREFLHFARDLERGDRKAKLQLDSGKEFIEISKSLNNFLDKRSNQVKFLKTIGEEGSRSSYEPGHSDILGNEIKVMAERLSRSQKEVMKRQEEDRIRNWASEGIARFSELLRTEREDLGELSFQVVKELVTYLQIEMGILFLANRDQDGENILEAVAAFAYDRRKYIDRTFRFGEGLPGTCAIEKEKIYINDMPENYSEIISGVGQARPRNALLVPLMHHENTFGVIELASFRKIDEHEIKFVDQITEAIVSGLLMVKNNERTVKLLDQSRKQAEQLLQQEEALKNNLIQLENARDEYLKKESENNEKINAFEASSLVAEFNLNGRFIHINDPFQKLLESPKDLIIGKHHSDFAVVEKYSDDYKSFWKALKEGASVRREDKYRLLSGREIWLSQAFTPIRNRDEQVTRILGIVEDLTAFREIEQQLEENEEKPLTLKKEQDQTSHKDADT